jgi:hypothetical protein
VTSSGGAVEDATGNEVDPGPSDVTPPRTLADAWTWLLLAAAGFIAGQIVSSVLLVLIASANGHLHDLTTLETRTVPP